MKLFDLYATVTLETRELEKGVQEAKKEMSGLEKFMSTQGKSIKDSLSQMFTFSAGQLLANGIQNVANWFTETASKSVELASALNEVQNVVDVTFGDSADTINAWAKNAKSAFGITETKAKQYTGTLGAMLKSMGLADDAVVSMSTDMAGLAGDMASFYNLDYDVAFEKIRSGLSGETEPLKALGINMTEANLQAYALSKGLDKTYQKMTQAEKAALRYSYLMETTADAQGDFARTNTEYANSLRLFQSNMDTVAAEFGQGLLAAITPALNMVNDWFAGKDDPLKNIADTQNSEVAEAEVKFRRTKTLIEDIDRMQQEQGEAAQGTDEWNSALKALVETMPELGKYIDLNTGKLKTNTSELLKNAELVHGMELYSAQKNAATSYDKKAQEARKTADETYVESVMNESNISYTESLIKDKVKELASATGISVENLSRLIKSGESGNGGWISLQRMYKGRGNYDKDPGLVEYLQALFGQRETYIDQRKTLNSKVKQTEADAQKAEQDAELAHKALQDRTYATAKAQDDYNAALKNEITILDQVKQANEKVASYRSNALKNARKDLDNFLDGFTGIELNSEDMQETYSMKNLLANLTSEQTFSEAFKNSLIRLKDRGLTDEALAALSTPSQENFYKLQSLETASDADFEEWNKRYTELGKQKDELAKTISDNRLAVDDEYAQMVQDLETAIGELDQAEAARAAMMSTGNGIIDAMDETITEMQNRLDIMLGLWGELGIMDSFTVAKTKSAPGRGNTTMSFNAKGLDYVPYDDYLTYLHKGETVLPKVEAESYRAGNMQQGQSIDYGRMSAAIASALSGATVEMDGQTVGVLIAPVVSGEIEKKANAGRYA